MCPKNASVYNNSKSLHPSTTLTILESATGSENDILQKMSLTEDSGPSPAPIDEPGRFARIWNKKTVPLYLLILFPVICMRSVTFFTKFNCLGKSQLIQVAILNLSIKFMVWLQDLSLWRSFWPWFVTGPTLGASTLILPTVPPTSLFHSSEHPSPVWVEC